MSILDYKATVQVLESGAVIREFKLPALGMERSGGFAWELQTELKGEIEATGSWEIQVRVSSPPALGRAWAALGGKYREWIYLSGGQPIKLPRGALLTFTVNKIVSLEA